MIREPQIRCICTSCCPVSRVGNLLGAGFPKTARLTSLISISLSTAFMAVTGVLLLTLRNQLAYIYTDDPEVGYWMSVIAPIAALFQVSAGDSRSELKLVTKVS